MISINFSLPFITKYLPVFLLCMGFMFCRAQSDNSLVAKFTFNTANATNEINGKHAKAPSVLYVEDRFGNARSACYLHGSPGSYLNLGCDPELKPVKATIALWVKIDIAMYGGTGYQFNPIVLTKNNNGDDFCEAYSISYNYEAKKTVVATTLSEKRQVQLYDDDTLTLREWHHVVMAYNDDSLFFYVDGKLNSAIAKGFRSVFLSTDSVMIGNSASKKNDRFLCGGVDDIMIYNRVLSAQEIEDLYNLPDPNKRTIYLRWFYKLLGVIALVALLSWLVISRNKQKLKKVVEKNKINARLNELETRAIRAQMNPHFIFNSLNTLQRFILEDDTANAHIYLTQFSELLRKLLESSMADSISLKEEIEILTQYIEIEKLRFGNSFNFIIHSDIEHPETIFIPFMLIQPLVENAIWHGLLPKEKDQVLSISFTNVTDSLIICAVEDNGVGRTYATKQAHTSNKKSMALDFIKQRLEIIEKATGIKGRLVIVDKLNADNESTGTLVEILIPKIN